MPSAEPKVELEAFYPHPPEHVWRALTRPEALEQWLMRSEGFRPEVGAKFRFFAKPVLGWKGVAYCEVLSVDPPRSLAWSQRGEEGAPHPFLVTWTLSPEPGGTRLRLVHEGFEPGLKGLLVRKMMGAGWRRMFRLRIPAVLDYAAAKGWDRFPPGRRLLPSDCHAD